MASVTFDKFLPEVMPECSGVPEPVAINAIRNACFDFCRQSLFWTVTLDPVAYTANVAEYDVDAPSGAVPVMVMNLVLDDSRTVTSYSLDNVAAVLPSWRTATGPIAGFMQPSNDVIRFVPIPSTSGVFVPTVAYAPERDATTVESSIYTLYLETIKYGALAKLKAMPGQPWSDPAAAMQYDRLFSKGIGDATIARTRGNGRTSLSVEMRSFV